MSKPGYKQLNLTSGKMQDKSGQSWLSTLAVALSNFSIQYNFGCIAIALLIMAEHVCTLDRDQCRQGKQQAWVQSVSSSVVFIGAVLGQLVMGRLGDLIGRSPALLVTTCISTISAALQAIAPSGSPEAIYAVIILFRFFLGVGVGGIYPLSATKAVEDTVSGGGGGGSGEGEGGGGQGEEDEQSVNKRANQKAVAAGKGFFWQMPGMMAPFLMSYILSYSSLSIDAQWRLELGFGAIPSGAAMLCLYLEMREKNAKFPTVMDSETSGGRGTESIPPRDIGNGQSSHACLSPDVIPEPVSLPFPDSVASSQESPVYDDKEASVTLPSQYNINAVSTNSESHQSSSISSSNILSMIVSNQSIRQRLYATGVCWFCFDVVVYGIGLIAPLILAAITHDTENITSQESIRSLSKLTLGTMGLSIPGTLLTIWIIPYKGVKWIQVAGFVIMATFCLLMGVLFTPLHNDIDGLFGVYCLLSVAVSLGVGISTYTLPALLFDREIRTTFNGICAAMGKVGAVVGTMSFGGIARSSSNGYTVVMIICFFVSTVAAFLSQRFIVLTPQDRQARRAPGSPARRVSELEIKNVMHVQKPDESVL